MRILIDVATGKLIEMQSDARPGTLLKNAINCGYDPDAVQEMEITPEEYEQRSSQLLSRRPPPISDRQFIDALKNAGYVTHAERISFLRGTIPSQLQSAINAIPDQNTRESAESFLVGAISFERDHPMTGMLAQAMGWSDEQLDELWIAAAQL